MKRQIRNGVFETNSSIVHTLTICTKKEFDEWKNGELLFDSDNEEFVTLAYDKDLVGYVQTYDEFYNDFDYGMTVKEYTTKSGDEIVSFGGAYHA